MDGRLAEQLMRNLQTGLVLLDEKHRVVAWNNWMTRHSGLEPGAVIGMRFCEVFPEAEGTRLLGGINEAISFKLASMLTPGLHAGILPLYHKPEDRQADRRLLPLIYISPILDEDGCACMIQVQDMTATVRRERQLRARSSQILASAYRDAITNVGNRRRFDDELARSFREAAAREKHLCLLMIDIDDFRTYNDRLGQAKGDECLKRVARTLQEGLRHNGDGIFRYGGEEFAILLPDIERENATSVAERLRRRVESAQIPHPASRAGAYVTVSMGVSGFVPKPEQPHYDLISQADLALYVAKDDGRNRVMCYDSERNEVSAIRA
jgi:diguanylate cyclase (GGDEF)-like protein